MLFINGINCAMRNVSCGICGQRRLRSTCAFPQSDQGFHRPLTESLETTECMNWKSWYFAHAQVDLNLRTLHIFEDTFFAWRDPFVLAKPTMRRANSEDSDQSAHCAQSDSPLMELVPSTAPGLSRTLATPVGCTCWSESLLVLQVLLKVLSCPGSNER